jgi:hypothetical protein
MWMQSPGARRKRDLIIIFSSSESRDICLDKMFVAMERVCLASNTSSIMYCILHVYGMVISTYIA